MSTIDRSSTTIKDLYQGLNVITTLLKDINTAVKDDPATNKKIDEAIETFAKISTNTTEVLSLVKDFDFSTLQSTVKDLQAHALKQEEVSAAWTKSSTNMAWNLGSRMTAIEISQTALKTPSRSVTPTLALTYIPANVEGENATNTAIEEPRDVSRRTSRTCERRERGQLGKREQKSKCRYCAKDYCSDTKIHGTSTLRGHLKVCGKFPRNKLDGQTNIAIQRGDGDDRKMFAWKFDQQSIRRALAYMLIVDELPFKLAVEMCLLKWGIESNVFTITVDNATANDVAVAYLKSKFANWETTVLEGKWLHVRCTAHVMNLIVQDGLSHIGKSVDCVRAAVKYVRQSPQRLTKFKEYAEIEKCPSKKGLILDVQTRWNSTYLMLEIAQNYERAFARYDSEDRHYRDDLEKTGVPVSSDWANVRRLTKFLEHFYELTLKVSGTLYVTSNSFLDDITSIEAALNNCINGVPDKNLVVMAKMMKCKFHKYYGSLEKCNMATVVASVLDPRNKFEYVEVLLGDVYGKVEGKSMCGMIKASLVELYEDYVRIHAPPETHTLFESSGASSSMNKRPATPIIEPSVALKQKSRTDFSFPVHVHMVLKLHYWTITLVVSQTSTPRNIGDVFLDSFPSSSRCSTISGYVANLLAISALYSARSIMVKFALVAQR
ncbi:zinc finger BED domain-containing protein RICESLEEPER 2-like protein [Tanacetum coccineum]|uniref:Zinc finger BED domain-containing protein RICESLEEPER 2-like protein n=1 Tax=Tanacetum coccineum TaxID=301880 RepID=A0ABQ5GZ13_9ASTR